MSTTATIERPATTAFRPTFSELLASEDRELLREPLRRWISMRGNEPRTAGVAQRERREHHAGGGVMTPRHRGLSASAELYSIIHKSPYKCV